MIQIEAKLNVIFTVFILPSGVGEFRLYVSLYVLKTAIWVASSEVTTMMISCCVLCLLITNVPSQFIFYAFFSDYVERKFTQCLFCYCVLSVNQSYNWMFLLGWVI